MRRAESRVRPDVDGPRFEVDRSWLLRGALIVLVIGFVLLLAKVSMMAFGGSKGRLDRHEQATPTMRTTPTAPAETPP